MKSGHVMRVRIEAKDYERITRVMRMAGIDPYTTPPPELVTFTLSTLLEVLEQGDTNLAQAFIQTAQALRSTTNIPGSATPALLASIPYQPLQTMSLQELQGWLTSLKEPLSLKEWERKQEVLEELERRKLGKYEEVR